jgi:predicted nucleotidyltransferase
MNNTAAVVTFDDPLEVLGLPPSTGRILRYFALRPDAQPHARHVQRVLEIGAASTQRDLERLVTIGALERSREGRMVRYRAVASSPVWRAVRLLIGSVADPTGLIAEALRDVPGVQGAFVFGSMSNGTQRADSDVDVFVIEDADIDQRSLLRQLAEVTLLAGREVNAVRYTTQALAERLGDPDHAGARFVRETLQGSKRWVAGSPAAILSLATAAGVRMPEAVATGRRTA